MTVLSSHFSTLVLSNFQTAFLFYCTHGGNLFYNAFLREAY